MLDHQLEVNDPNTSVE